MFQLRPPRRMRSQIRRLVLGGLLCAVLSASAGCPNENHNTPSAEDAPVVYERALKMAPVRASNRATRRGLQDLQKTPRVLPKTQAASEQDR